MPQETPLNMRNLLNRNVFFVNDNQATGPGEVIFKAGQGHPERQAGSGCGEDRQQEVQKGIENYCEEAEAACMINLMEYILGKTRKITKDTKLSKDKVEQERNWIEAAWEKEYLRFPH